jgi:4-hydroxy-tetrahydrodipicolinate synthase
MVALNDGIYAAAMTPWNADLSCNVSKLTDHCKDILSRGLSGVVLFGTTGEGPSFSLAERISITDEVLLQVSPSRVVLGNGGATIPETVAIAKHGVTKGCIALLAHPPTFFKNCTDEGVIAFYRAVIQQTNDPALKIILYHIPQFTGVPITMNVIRALVEEFPESIIGIKESKGDLAFAKEIIAAFPAPAFKTFVGSEAHIIEAVGAGGSGSICGMANLYPELICSLFESGKKGSTDGNPPCMADFFAALKYPFIPAFKAIKEQQSGSTGTWTAIRPPLAALTNEERDTYLGSLPKMGI